jgi:hypothetical protein
MPHDPHAAFDEAVLDLIDHSPTGAVPGTPSHQDALKRLRAAHKVYADADHKDGYVTARALASRPCFHAANLEDLIAGRIEPEALEPNGAIFDRYVKSLPAALQARAEAVRAKVVGRAVVHRAKTSHVHDPLHSLFMVPGAGPHPGLPGNYLHGQIVETGASGPAAWALQLHDSDDGVAVIEEPTLAAVLAHLQEVFAAAPFAMDELEALGFRMI